MDFLDNFMNSEIYSSTSGIKSLVYIKTGVITRYKLIYERIDRLPKSQPFQPHYLFNYSAINTVDEDGRKKIVLIF